VSGGRSVLRLFVAAYPSPEVVERLLEHAARLAPPGRRLVAPEQVHMTIQFVGDTDPRELPEVEESVRRSAAGLSSFELRPHRLMTLPPGPRPRLIAVETDAPPSLVELHRRLATRLARNSRERPGDRFLPHLTVCRYGGLSGPKVNEPIDGPRFAVNDVRLMRSILGPSGAQHVEVIRVGLAAPA
jgi:RNA 2',3'-cyclic 3'-phosphodiesterase